MKFVIDGRTFDTAACATVAVSRGISLPSHDMVGDLDIRFEEVLYRTAEGRFFVHEHAAEKSLDGGPGLVTDQARELSPADAAAWILDHDAAVIDATGLPLPDAARGAHRGGGSGKND